MLGYLKQLLRGPFPAPSPRPLPAPAPSPRPRPAPGPPNMPLPPRPLPRPGTSPQEEGIEDEEEGIEEEDEGVEEEEEGTSDAIAIPAPGPANPDITRGNAGTIAGVDSRVEAAIRADAEADEECTYCEYCEFLTEGALEFINYGNYQRQDRRDLIRRAMNYQNYVVHWFLHLPDQNQIEEWVMNDPSARSGKRKMDGFAAQFCFLVEAKYGYSRYLRSVPGGRVGGFVEVRGEGFGRDAMRNMLTQLQNHQALAARFPRVTRFGDFWHHVIWAMSNSLTNLWVGDRIYNNEIGAGGDLRIAHFHIGIPNAIAIAGTSADIERADDRPGRPIQEDE